MGVFKIKGGNRLRGEISLGGAKNAVLPILAAAALSRKGKTILYNVPDIADVRGAMQVLSCSGCKAGLNENIAAIDAKDFNGKLISDAAKSMRGSILFLGAALARTGAAEIHRPGGCHIGSRPIDLHLRALRLMGATIEETDDGIYAKTKGLTGASVKFPFPSVGATEQAMIAASTAKGVTVITNAAREPEIIDLQKFLRSMGAEVAGAGTGTIVINGVKRLSPAVHTVMPDRIVGGTYLCAAAVTGGEITLHKTRESDLLPIIRVLRAIGAKVDYGDGLVKLKSPKARKGSFTIKTAPHPGFPTDMAPQTAAVLALTSGEFTIKEEIFESRMGHAEELASMGADASVSADRRSVVIKGVKKLTGSNVCARDLRCGAALVVAGLAAEGETNVYCAEYIARGYERLDERLNALGGEVEYAD